MRLSKRGAVLLLVLMICALAADAILPNVTDANVVQAGGGILAVVVIGGIVIAIMASGSSTKICDADDPERAQKIKDFFEQNRG